MSAGPATMGGRWRGSAMGGRWRGSAMGERWRWAAAGGALLALAALSACAVNPATGRESFTGFMSRDDEARIGAEEHPKLIKDFGGAYGDVKLRAYVTRNGLELARYAEDTSLAWTFTVLNDPKVNAFALPGGYVYITRGLLALAENEAEMAGVLAHEIGHVMARHTAERYSATMATNLGLMVLGVIGSSAGLPSGIGQIVSYGAQAALQGYSREQELEADMLGVRYMARGGYSPHAMRTFFEKLEAHDALEAAMADKEQAPRHTIMSTHPRTAQRIAQAIELARLTPVTSPAIRRDAFLAEIDGMVFGDDPGQGVRRGRTFSHPALRITFTAPPDFQLFNSPRQVVGRGPGKSVMVFDLAGTEAAKRAGAMDRYLAETWAPALTLSDLERIDVNGMAAATAGARLSTRDGPRDMRLVAIRGGPERIFRLLFLTPPAVTAGLTTEMRRTTYSFRRLSEAEAGAITPLRIRVATVASGDTPETLADAMPVGRFALGWFRVLNGLRAGQGLQPGARVKTVAP